MLVKIGWVSRTQENSLVGHEIFALVRSGCVLSEGLAIPEELDTRVAAGIDVAKFDIIGRAYKVVQDEVVD